ncbi:MAG: hypothetical protein HY423_13445 [Candidatus Lambdaproteobacteria bacterium]|nr:hypothetical protein [Candidatus Lambdaproteobacteria bacterium]
MESLSLAVRFAFGQPPAVYLAWNPWHLLLVLLMLALLAALGAHHLLGDAVGFYRVGGRPAAGIAVPSLIVLLVSVPLLVAAYLTGTQAEPLAQAALRPADAQANRQLGGLLLAPVLKADEEARPLTRGQMEAALKAASDTGLREAYRAALAAAEPPSPATGPSKPATTAGETRPAEGANPAPGPAPAAPAAAPAAPGAKPQGSGPGNPTPAVLGSLPLPERVALHWLTVAGQTWPESLPVLPGQTVTQKSFVLPELLTALLHEAKGEEPRPRAEWERVAGRAFVRSALLPDTTRWIERAAVGLLVALLLFDGIFFLAVRALRRWAERRAGRGGAGAGAG